MPNKVLDSFIAGRTLALRQQALQRAEEQRRLDNERAEKQDKLDQQREERIAKQAELEFNAQQAALNLKKAEMRAGIKSGIAIGTAPATVGTSPVNKELQLPLGVSYDLPDSIPTGDTTAVLEPEVRDFIGGDIRLNVDQVNELREAEAARIQRIAEENYQKSLNSPTVMAAEISQAGQTERETFKTEQKRLEREQELADEQRKREERKQDQRETARFNNSLVVNRQEQAEARKKQNEEAALQKVVGGGAGQLIAIQGATGYLEYNASQLPLVAEATQQIMPHLIRAKGIETNPTDIYIPIEKKRGDEIRDNAKIVPILKRTSELATRLIKEDKISDSLLKSMANKSWEDIKGLAGYSEIKKALEPLEADAIILARTLARDRVTDRDAAAFMAQLIGLGLNTDLMQARVNDLVDRSIGVIEGNMAGVPLSQRKAFWPETLNLERFKDIKSGQTSTNRTGNSEKLTKEESDILKKMGI